MINHNQNDSQRTTKKTNTINHHHRTRLSKYKAQTRARTREVMQKKEKKMSERKENLLCLLYFLFASFQQGSGTAVHQHTSTAPCCLSFLLSVYFYVLPQEPHTTTVYSCVLSCTQMNLGCCVTARVVMVMGSSLASFIHISTHNIAERQRNKEEQTEKKTFLSCSFAKKMKRSIPFITTSISRQTHYVTYYTPFPLSRGLLKETITEWQISTFVLILR